MKYYSLLAIAAVATLLCSCDDTKSYAELLTDENRAVNMFLADQEVLNELPDTSEIKYGADAPYYRLDEDNNVYMQVINPGTLGDESMMAQPNELLYFRFMRYSLYEYKNGKLGDGYGNDNDLTFGTASFRYQNNTSQSSYEWGSGIQLPLKYLPYDCEVNLVIKSQFGIYSEIQYVTPYLYKVRYFKSPL